MSISGAGGNLNLNSTIRRAAAYMDKNLSQKADEKHTSFGTMMVYDERPDIYDGDRLVKVYDYSSGKYTDVIYPEDKAIDERLAQGEITEEEAAQMKKASWGLTRMDPKAFGEGYLVKTSSGQGRTGAAAGIQLDDFSALLARKKSSFQQEEENLDHMEYEHMVYELMRMMDRRRA